MYHVYTLTDPRDTKVRYVGMSQDAHKRYASHLATLERHCADKDKWLQELVSLGYTPILNIIETVETKKEALAKEHYWIQRHLSASNSLTNVRCTPKEKERRSMKAAKKPPQEAMPSDYLTPSDVGEILGVSAYTVLTWLRERRLPGYRFGYRWKVKKAELETWKHNQRNIKGPNI